MKIRSEKKGWKVKKKAGKKSSSWLVDCGEHTILENDTIGVGKSIKISVQD